MCELYDDNQVRSANAHQRKRKPQVGRNNAPDLALQTSHLQIFHDTDYLRVLF